MPLIKLYIDISQTIPLKDQSEYMYANAKPMSPMADGSKRYSFEVNIPEPECEQAEKLPRVNKLIEDN